MNQKILFEIKKFKNKNLPIAVFFSDRNQGYNFADLVKNMPKNSAIIIREYDLNNVRREELAKEVISLAKPLNIKVLIGKDLNLAKKVKADGVHFSDHDNLPRNIKNRSNFIFSYSCHSLKSILRAIDLKPDMIFISPIFKTNSHPDTKPIGMKNLARYLSKISLKTKSHTYCENHIYALGGINSQNISSIRKLNLAGFGAISLFTKYNENHSRNSFWRFWNKIVAAFSSFKS